MKCIELLESILKGKNNCIISKKDAEGKNISTIINKNPAYNDCRKDYNFIKIIPKEYVDFLSFSNGMELYNYDDIDGVRLLSLEEMEEYTLYAKNTFEDNWQDNILIFAKIIGEDSYLGFKLYEMKYEIVDCYFEVLPSEWSVIGENFDDFLQKYISKNGDKYWIN